MFVSRCIEIDRSYVFYLNIWGENLPPTSAFAVCANECALSQHCTCWGTYRRRCILLSYYYLEREYTSSLARERWSGDVTDIKIFDGARAGSGYQCGNSQMSEMARCCLSIHLRSETAWCFTCRPFFCPQHDPVLFRRGCPWCLTLYFLGLHSGFVFVFMGWMHWH